MGEFVQPVVLVGGRSKRFGRDKLVEPIGMSNGLETWLVDRPIHALRECFGQRVGVVGECDPRIHARADLVVPDPHPGIGPLGGIVSALRWAHGSVFVLAGDMPSVTPDTVRRLLAAAAMRPKTGAVLATTHRVAPPQWCVGIYRSGLTSALERAVQSGVRAVKDAVPRESIELVEVEAGAVRDVDSLADLS